MEPKSPESRRTETKEMATDMEMALFYAIHIDNPCEVELGPGLIGNIRNFYIKEVEGILPTIKNPDARKLLESKLEQYKK